MTLLSLSLGFGKAAGQQTRQKPKSPLPANKSRPVPPGFDATKPIPKKTHTPSQMDLFSNTPLASHAQRPLRPSIKPNISPRSILMKPGYPYPNRGSVHFKDTVTTHRIAFSPADQQHVDQVGTLPLAAPKKPRLL